MVPRRHLQRPSGRRRTNRDVRLWSTEDTRCTWLTIESTCFWKKTLQHTLGLGVKTAQTTLWNRGNVWYCRQWDQRCGVTQRNPQALRKFRRKPTQLVSRCGHKLPSVQVFLESPSHSFPCAKRTCACSPMMFFTLITTRTCGPCRPSQFINSEIRC